MLRRKAVLRAAESYGAACKRLELALTRVPNAHSELWPADVRAEFDRILAEVESSKQTLLMVASKFNEPFGKKQPENVPRFTDLSINRG